MNDFKEWYINHQEGCDYCIEVDESNRNRLMDEHTISAWADYSDAVYEAYKDA